MDYEIIIPKINECSRSIEHLFELDDGSFLITFVRLHNQLRDFFDNIHQRKNHGDHSMNNRADLKNSEASTSIENSIEQPRVKGFCDIAGLLEAKKNLRMMILLPKDQPQLFVNRRYSNRILLFGPPGTGKTLLVHAIAAEMKAVFHSISASNILSPLVGQSEKIIRNLFQYAKGTHEYSLIFIDELDGFCRKRNDSEQDHSRRLKTEIMCQLSSIEDCNNIFVICATNCPWDLDTAILRRFQKHIFITLPDRNERLHHLIFHTNSTSLKQLQISEWDEVLNLTEGFSSSDLSVLVQNAMDRPLLELQETIVWKKTNDNLYQPADEQDDPLNIFCKYFHELPPNSVQARPIKLDDLIIEAKKYKPTVSDAEMERYSNFNKK
ncbi:hypothetical protein WA026_021729 [Henosepilachna vigintioctopunctata]